MVWKNIIQNCLKSWSKFTGGDDITFGNPNDQSGAGGVEQVARETVNCEDLLEGTRVPLDIFSYHYYNGISDVLLRLCQKAIGRQKMHYQKPTCL